MSDCGSSDISSQVEASVRQSRVMPVLFAVLTFLVLVPGLILADMERTFVSVACGLVAWWVVQFAAIGYLRTSPRHPGVGIPVLTGILTVAACWLISLTSPGLAGAIIVAGTWLACGTASEFARGSRWRRDVVADTAAGDAARLLAVNGGYDGTPIAHFAILGLLVGGWVFLADRLWWTLPFALVAHIGVGLFFASRGTLARRGADMVG